MKNELQALGVRDLPPGWASELRALGSTLKVVVGGYGFALLIFSHGAIQYLSNGQQDDVRKAIAEWSDRRRAEMDREQLAKTPSDAADAAEAMVCEACKRETRSGMGCIIPPHTCAEHARWRLEARCAELGRTIATPLSTLGSPGSCIALFLFDFGPVGNIAYFTNNANIDDDVRRWLDAARGEGTL